MPKVLVESISHHPYGGRFHTRGSHYEVDSDEDLKLLQDLKRVRILDDAEAQKIRQQYRTRDMRAEGGAGIVGTRGTVPVNKESTPAQVGEALKDVEPTRGRARAKTAAKPDDTGQ